MARVSTDPGRKPGVHEEPVMMDPRAQDGDSWTRGARLTDPGRKPGVHQEPGQAADALGISWHPNHARGSMASRETAPQLNRVVRHSSQPVPESSASIAAVRPTTHPQPRVSWGTRATIPKPTNVAVAPPTSIQSSQLRRLWAAPVLSPASAARTYAGSTAYRVPSRAAASCQRRCSAPVADASAIATAPSVIRSDPPITCPYVVAAPPRSSPNTSSPHTSPHNWFVLDSGIPRLIPTYFAAYC